MRKVIGIGETILDIIFRNEQPSAAVPGGGARRRGAGLGPFTIRGTYRHAAESAGANSRTGMTCLSHFRKQRNGGETRQRSVTCLSALSRIRQFHEKEESGWKRTWTFVL